MSGDGDHVSTSEPPAAAIIRDDGEADIVPVAGTGRSAMLETAGGAGGAGGSVVISASRRDSGLSKYRGISCCRGAEAGNVAVAAAAAAAGEREKAGTTADTANA